MENNTLLMKIHIYAGFIYEDAATYDSFEDFIEDCESAALAHDHIDWFERERCIIDDKNFVWYLNGNSAPEQIGEVR